MDSDVLVVSPHPDDAEMGCGGTIAGLCRSGVEVAMCYLTRGEMGTRGDRGVRETETREAMRLLGVSRYVYAEMPDSALFNSKENRLKLVRVIREFRPRLVLAPFHDSMHPDHVQSSFLAADSSYLSGLLKLETGQQRHRPSRILYYPLHSQFEPTVVVDITATFGEKMEAIRAYRSQFHNPSQPDAPQTLLSAPDFLDRLEAQARYFGSLIGRSYGEGFRVELPLAIDHPSEILRLV